jgi:hypothetical protein
VILASSTRPVINQMSEPNCASTEGLTTVNVNFLWPMRLIRYYFCDPQTSSKLPSSYKQSSQTVLAVKPANYVSLSRKVVSGTFVIDPTLKVPSWLRVAPQAGSQWNLHLTSTSTQLGQPSDVVIHLEPGDGVRPSARTRMCVKSSNGAEVKLVCALPVS